MRLQINKDEVASFRHLVRRALDNGVENVELRLYMPKADAEQMLAKTTDNGLPIVCVWSCGFRADT